MECLWSVFSHWQPHGYCHEQDTPVFYVCLDPYDGIPDHYLYDPGFLEKYEEIYLGSETESLVLLIG